MTLSGRRFLALQALLAWQGGFFFYAAVVVPIGTDILGSAAAQGTITQQVTNWLNRIGVVALAVLAWDVAVTPPYRRRRWATWAGMAALLAVLFFLHTVLDANFDPARRSSPDPATFNIVHGAYLWVSSAQWLLGLAFAWFTVAAWGRAAPGPPPPRG
jgi:hypothetical protein